MTASSSSRERTRSRLLCVQEVADELGVCTKTVRRQIDAGLLPVSRIGRAVRIAEDDLEIYRRLSRAPATQIPASPGRTTRKRQVVTGGAEE